MRTRRLLLLISVLALAAPVLADSVTPSKDTLYTSTRDVRAMVVAPDGSLWAATMGGVLRRTPDGVWHKFTQMDGLPSCEALGLSLEGKKIKFAFPTRDGFWDNGQWTFKPAEGGARNTDYYYYSHEEQVFTADYHGKTYKTSSSGLYVFESGKWKCVEASGEASCCPSAVVWQDRLLVPVYRGIGSFDGKNWNWADLKLPKQASYVTAIVILDGKLWIGTPHAGIWEQDGTTWKQHQMPDEPPGTDFQCLRMYKGELYASTLEDQICVRGPQGWRKLPKVPFPEDHVASSYQVQYGGHPRQMIEYGGSLEIRDTGNRVWSFDGTKWNDDLPISKLKHQVDALATDGKRLYTGGWGGWSEWDGKSWMDRLKVPLLQGREVTCLLPDWKYLWVGTQGIGLAQVDQTTGQIAWHDERNGLADDWVTCLCKVGDRLYAGTFYNGLEYYEGGKWSSVSGVSSSKISDIIPDGKGGVLVATMSGVWQVGRGEPKKLFTAPNSPDIEANCLLLADGGLWIGTRTGIYFKTESGKTSQ